MTFVTEFFEAVPWFLPGMAVWATLSVLVSSRLARLLHTKTTIAFLLALTLGAIIFATLTPTAAALSPGLTSHDACNLSRLGLAPLAELTSINDTSRNVVLFIPLGFAIGLLPAKRRSLAAVLAALLLTLLIETTQLLLPALGRGCQSADIVDNIMGLTIGLAFSLVIRWVVPRLQRRDR